MKTVCRPLYVGLMFFFFSRSMYIQKILANCTKQVELDKNYKNQKFSGLHHPYSKSYGNVNFLILNNVNVIVPNDTEM